MISVGILGASGYMGGEVLRVVLEHPQLELAWATSRTLTHVSDAHPNLTSSGVSFIQPDAVSRCDVVFMALPTSQSLAMVEPLLAMGCRIIDLGAAFRLKDRDVWERLYDQSHTRWPLAMSAVYGISELYYDAIAQASLVANPGCFSSAVILGLTPLLNAGWVETKSIIVTGLSGTAGVGAELSRAAHHPEIGNNLVAYNAVDHRHSYEMEQVLSLVADDAVRVHFSPVYVPITRGILTVISSVARHSASRAELLALYRDYYRSHPFVSLYDGPYEEAVQWQYKPYPWVSTVAGTNACYIGLDVDERRGRIVVFSVLDSLGKGGAQVGVENLNIMFGLDRTAGLRRFGLHPN